MTSSTDVPADPVDGSADPRQRLRIIIAVTSVLIAIAAGTAALVSTVSPPGVPSHVVGQYSGLTIQEVRAAAEANAWVLDEDQVRTNTAQVGIVINQNPLPETLLQEGELLNVDVASGPLLVQLPAVAGLSVDEAVEILDASGFVVGLITPSTDAGVPDAGVPDPSAPDERVPGGRVIELVVNQDQPASLLANQLIDSGSSGTDSDAGYEPGTVVTLIVSPGTQPPSERLNVPNLVGLTLAQARAVVEDAGLELMVVVSSADGADGDGGADGGDGTDNGDGTDGDSGAGDGNDGGSGDGDTGDGNDGGNGNGDSESSSESVVITQDPPAGQSVAAGSSVNVTVASDTSSNS